MSFFNNPLFFVSLIVVFLVLTVSTNNNVNCNDGSILSPVEPEEPVCVPVLTIPEEEVFEEEEESRLTMLPETVCGSTRGYVICGIENGVAFMINDCRVTGDSLTPEEREHYCGDGRAGGIYR